MSDQTYVLELSQQDADTVRENGDYSVTLSQSIALNEGDSLTLKMASIDSQRSDSNSIIIPEDLNVSVRFSYYDIDYDKTDKSLRDESGPWADATFGHYIGYDEPRILSLTSVQYLCPTYHGVNNAVIVYPFFSWIDENGVHRHSDTVTVRDPYTYSGGATGPNGAGIATCVPTVNHIVFKEGSLTITGFKALEGYLIPTTPTTKVSFVKGSEVTTVVAAGSRDIVENTAGVIIKAGRYDRNTLAIALTRGFTEKGISPEILGTDQYLSPDSDLVLRVDNPDYAGLIFTPAPDDKSGDMVFDNTSYIYKNHTSGNVPSLQVGARKFSVEYGQTGAVYQLSNAHQSAYNAASPGQENLAIYKTGTAGVDLRYHQVDSVTGIAIHGLLPASFWRDTLGLYDNLIVPLTEDSNGVSYYDKTDIVDRLPKESATIPVFSFSNDRVITDPIAVSPLYIDTTATPTKAILGDDPENLVSAYFLVEINGLGIAGNYIDSAENRANIMGVVSTQYDSNQIITGFSDSGISYVHRGAPTRISGAKVRILDPITKDVVDSLGSHNSIFLQVVRSGKV